ncbi:Ubp5-interacting protein [Escovopsis weberi]|uniref:Ubp5-interacting protein n=1 Tax=Escovopsis weberi TaxID=150374 RepID=A0A0M8MXE4_ESCWE|nr:Ubp5-interacting protein [Escovopsis weberi]
MGASDSKLVFKRGIFKLSEDRSIAVGDPYWTSFWELPESSEDVFSLFSPTDIRRTRDNALENVETLIQALTSRLFALRHHPSFPDVEIAPEREALNCIRILTRILPYLHEKENLASWEETFFWGPRKKKTRKASIANEVLFDGAHEGAKGAVSPPDEFEDAKPLAEELIDTLIDLLFFSDFTLPRPQGSRSKVTYSIWQSGVGCNTAIATTKEFESNRCEILRLLMTLAGQSMYTTSSCLPKRGVRTLTYLCTCPDKQIVLSVLCSLLNTTMKYHPASWRVPYNTLVFKDTKQVLVTYSLHFLLAMLIYPVPESVASSVNKNYYRHYFGRVHRPQDFQFMVDGMMRILNQPLQEKASYLPGSQNAAHFAPEILMLFWELVQCNKRFRSFIIDTDRAHDFVVLSLFHALEYKNDPARQGVVRMCVFILQTLSVEPTFGIRLNRTFEGQDSLPAGFKINSFTGSYADFLLHCLYTLMSTSQGNFAPVYPAVLAVINNIAPHIQGLSAAGSTQLMHLFSSMSSPSNPELILSILGSRKRIEALRSFTLESGREEMERRNRRRKDSNGQAGVFDLDSGRSSPETARSPTANVARPHTLEEGPEESAFAIGDDDDDDDDDDDNDAEDESEGDPEATPTQSTTSEIPSRASSVANADGAMPVQLRGMSEKARGKMPANIQSFSRQNSSTSSGTYSAAGQTRDGVFELTPEWLDSWLPELPLHTLMSVLHQAGDLAPPPPTAGGHTPEAIRRVQGITFIGIEPSPIKVHSFEWSPMALGWYESLLWGVIFTIELQVAKGPMGIWSGTAIKLFRVQETAPQGPTLTSPRGAVDAVGSNIVSRIGQINLRGGTTPSAPTSPR